MSKIMYQSYIELVDSDEKFQPKQPEGNPLYSEDTAAILVKYMQKGLSLTKVRYFYEEVKTDV